MIKRPGKRVTDILVLCGGEGRRLKSVVSDRPKPMADIKGRPFLDILIGHIARQGFSRFILCAGYKSEIISRYYNDRSDSLDILISEEDKPLGTAGAIKNAQPLIRSGSFLVMNGDSFCALNLSEFIRFHNDKGADFSVVLTKSDSESDCGVVSLDKSGKITGFNEKIQADKDGFLNAGIYLFNKEIFSFIEVEKKQSLECNIFPKLIGAKFYGYVSNKGFTDIGTPDRYAKARKSLG
ncbi:MAG: sugar phosphate nucleotidyltransferase [Candidatus Omnitrophota bacterium]